MSLEDSDVLRTKERLDNLSLEYRTKLKPKKKTKDTRNYNPENKDMGGGDFLRVTSSMKSSAASFVQNRKSESLKEQTYGTKDDTINPRLTRSVDSLAHVNNFERNKHKKVTEQGKELNKLPSDLWWVSPLKPPSIYRPPSINMSEKSYSLISSASRPRVLRSAEDLRRQVITQCNQVEAAGYDQYNKSVEKLQETTSTDEQRLSSNQLTWLPAINIPSLTDSQSSMAVMENKVKTSLTQLQPHSPEIIYSQSDDNRNMINQFVEESPTKAAHSTCTSSGNLRSIQEPEKLCYKNLDHQGEQLSSSNADNYYTIGDIARKHIVNPIALKLARLCTKQGQLFSDVIDDLEKSFEDFEYAYKNQVQKK